MDTEPTEPPERGDGRGGEGKGGGRKVPEQANTSKPDSSFGVIAGWWSMRDRVWGNHLDKRRFLPKAFHYSFYCHGGRSLSPIGYRSTYAYSVPVEKYRPRSEGRFPKLFHFTPLGGRASF